MIHPFDVEKSKDLDIKMAEPLLKKIMTDGKPLLQSPAPKDVAAYVQKRMQQLPDEHKRFNNPHIYKVGISGPLHQLRSDLRKKYKV
jgi:nicotinate phosphoribosyltransferase